MKTTLRLLLSLVLLALSDICAHAAAKWWDINGTTAGSGQGMAIGTWGGNTVASCVGPIQF